MKKLIVGLFLFLTGCAMTNTTTPPTPAVVIQNAAQKLVKFCPLVQAVNAQIVGFPGVSQVVIDKLAVVNPMVDAVCSKGATISALNLQTLAQNGMPLLLDAIAISPLAATPQGQALVVGVNLAQLILPEIIAAVNQQ